MFDFLRKIYRDEQGAVTVDWVVITAAVVGFSAIGFIGFRTATIDLIETAGAAVGAEVEAD